MTKDRKTESSAKKRQASLNMNRMYIMLKSMSSDLDALIEGQLRISTQLTRMCQKFDNDREKSNARFRAWLESNKVSASSK